MNTSSSTPGREAPVDVAQLCGSNQSPPLGLIQMAVPLSATRSSSSSRQSLRALSVFAGRWPRVMACMLGVSELLGSRQLFLRSVLLLELSEFRGTPDRVQVDVLGDRVLPVGRALIGGQKS